MPIELIIRCPKCAQPPRDAFPPAQSDWTCLACGTSFPSEEWLELPADSDRILFEDELKRNFLRDQFYE